MRADRIARAERFRDYAKPFAPFGWTRRACSTDDYRPGVVWELREWSPDGDVQFRFFASNAELATFGAKWAARQLRLGRRRLKQAAAQRFANHAHAERHNTPHRSRRH